MDVTVKKISLSRLKMAEYNPRVDLQPGDAEYEHIKDSLDEFGLVEPLVVNLNGMRIISGHQRYKILKANGVKETEAVFVKLDSEEKEKLLNLQLNKIEGRWDNLKLAELLQEFDKEDVALAGFNEKELAALTAEYEAAMKQAEEEITEAENVNGAADAPQTTAEANEKEVLIYLSFERKDDAQRWLKSRNIEKSFNSGNNNINVYVKGGKYDAERD